MKYFLILLIIFAVFPQSCEARKVKNVKKFNAVMSSDFDPFNFSKTIEFVNDTTIYINGETIPEKSVVFVELKEAAYELRWHKSGYFVCHLLKYKHQTGKKFINVSDKNIYLVARKYERPDKKEIVFTSVELTASQAASFFFPGIDILYYFTKGAIQREKHHNRFKAGVYNAYENSIFWFCLKGKDILLDEGDEVYIKPVKKAKADELERKIIKRKTKKLKKIKRKYSVKTYVNEHSV